ncbi:fungal-specific transcription factor domain-containing protein [Coniochaeta sp. 2T2.1]|nr:fungal-specific transcription factor domain-containing protein [Coniochaeta sp. 2T2.1]
MGGDRSTDGGDISAPQTAPNSAPSSPRPGSGQRTPPGSGREPRGIYSSDQFRPTTRDYFYLISQCVELYYEHIYPIMPLLYMPTTRQTVRRPMTYPEKNLIYALCALTCLHMSGKSIQAQGPESWEAAGRFFIDECISVRQSYDFLEDQSLYAVISSFWLSTSFFEINQSRKSWMYLREALTLALDLGLDDDSTYVGLTPEEKLCRQRVFWILFVTERSFAILRNRPISFKKTPSLPRTRHSYEAPDIHSGFRQLISSYVPLDESFVAAWNDSSDPSVSGATYLALQDILSRPPAFLQRSRATTPSSDGTTRSLADIVTPSSTNVPTSFFHPVQTDTVPKPEPDDENSPFPFTVTTTDDTDPDPTAIQKADLLITQQWLRLIVWRSSEQRQLLSWTSPHESMDHAFPLEIARSTVSILESLPSTAVEVHGMGIFEKIFKIGAAYIDALSACDSAGPNLGRRLGLGMDFANGDLGVLGVGRRGVSIDPLEFFVKTLSSTPNSRTQFAEQLIVHASQRPGGMKMALSPPPRMFAAHLHMPQVPQQSWNAPVSMAGAVLGEITDEDELDPSTARVKRSRTSAMPAHPALSTEYPSDFDVGLISPGLSDPGFGGAIPGLTSAPSMWQPIMQPGHGTWAGADSSAGVPPLDAFSFGPTMTSEEFAYATFGSDGNGNQMPAGGGMDYPRYQHHQSAPGTEPTTPAGEGGPGTSFGMGLPDEGQGRKRAWDGGLGTW